MNIWSVFFDSFNIGILFCLKMFCLILQWRFPLLFITLFQTFHLGDWKGLLWYGYIKRTIRTKIFDWIKGWVRTGQKESKLKIPRRKECGYPEILRTIFSPHNSTQILLKMWKIIKCDNLLAFIEPNFNAIFEIRSWWSIWVSLLLRNISLM